MTRATPLRDVKERLWEFNVAAAHGKAIAPSNQREAREKLREIHGEAAAELDRMYFGWRRGCIGEVSTCLLFLGGIVLVALNCIKWQVPVLFIGTVGLLGWALPVPVRGAGAWHLLWFAGQPLFEIFAGGLFLGAFFMATDAATLPPTAWGQAICAVGCGVLTALIRHYGGYPEGVCYAILLMNTAHAIVRAVGRAKKRARERAAPAP